jgi:hypothetical protein
MDKYLHKQLWMIVVRSNYKLDEFANRLFVQILHRISDSRPRERHGPKRTRISMTKIRALNCDSGAPSVSTAIFPGQSHISKGITVLRVKSQVNEQLRKGASRQTVDALIGMFDDSHGGFKIERLFRGERVEENFFYRGLAAAPLSKK